MNRYRTYLLLRSLEERITPATFTVTNTNDAGVGSLRQAIYDSNTFPGADSIVFDATAFATGKTIGLTNGQLLILDSVSIIGPAAKLTIDGNHASRIFDITVPGQTCAISGLTLINGTAFGGDGGGIRVSTGNLEVTTATITGCTANGRGGGIGIYEGGNLTVTKCVISGNSSSTIGGGICHRHGQNLVVTDSTISNNSATASGGGIEFTGVVVNSGTTLGTLIIAGSTISGNHTSISIGNSGGVGGGLSLYAVTAVISNSTISGNLSYESGGLYLRNQFSTVLFQNCTIAFNTATQYGGGVYYYSGQIDLESTILAKNVSPIGPDAHDALTANYCLFGNTQGAGITGANNNLNIDPLLGPLANNGGPTLTHALLAGSPAINAGSNTAGLAFDQRGNPRSVGITDIGAYEVQAPAKISSVVINNGAAQRSMVTQLKVIFNQHIGFSGTVAAAFQLNRVGDNAAVNLAATVDDTGSGTAVTLTFTGGAVNGPSLADGRYALHIVASGFNAEGFDGDGNGIAAGSPTDDFAFDELAAPATLDTTKLFRLYGDITGDGSVNANDFIVFRQYFGGYLFAFDFDGDGSVSASDFIQFRLRFGSSI